MKKRVVKRKTNIASPDRGPSRRAAGAPKPRKTQAERSQAMRQRLIDATLECLAKEGYAGTTISKIVSRAKVSHGATGHHFPSKADLILAAAEDLANRTFHAVGGLAGVMDAEGDLFTSLVRALWANFHSKAEMKAILEIMVAAQRDKALAKAVGDLTARTEEIFDPAMTLALEPVPGGQMGPHMLFFLTRSVLLGLAAEFHSGTDAKEIRDRLDAWALFMGTQVRPRSEVPLAVSRPGRKLRRSAVAST
ncbi:TetR/AcrR family transcriptional regulator [Lysobacter fragariae]